MKKLAALLPLVLLGCAMYTAKPIKVFKGEVVKRQTYIGQLIDISGKSIKKEYKTLFTIVDGAELIHMGLPYFQDDSVNGYIVEGDSVKVVFGENPEIIYKQGETEFQRPEEFKKFYDSPKWVP